MFVNMLSPTLSTSTLVRQLRDRLGLSQEKLAVRLGVSFQTVSRWERGLVNPSPIAKKRLEGEVQRLGERGQDLMEGYFRK